MLSVFSRLLTLYIQIHGFTCGLNDVFLTKSFEKLRFDKVKMGDIYALKVTNYYFRSQRDIDFFSTNDRNFIIEFFEFCRNYSKETRIKQDVKLISVMHMLSSEIVKKCLPVGQYKQIFNNCMALMTVTGAKGSLVNFSQINCL